MQNKHLKIKYLKWSFHFNDSLIMITLYHVTLFIFVQDHITPIAS